MKGVQHMKNNKWFQRNPDTGEELILTIFRDLLLAVLIIILLCFI